LNWLKHLKVTHNFLVLFTVIIIALGTVGYMGYYYLLQANNAMNEMYNDRLLPVKWLNDNRNQSRAIEADIFDIMITTDDNENARLSKDIEDRTERFNKNLAAYEQTSLDSFEVDTLKELHANLQKYYESRNQVIALAIQNKNSEAYQLYNQSVRAYTTAFNKNLTDLAEYNAKTADKINSQNQSNFKKAILLFISIILFAVVLIVLLGWIIVRNITNIINAAISHLGEIAQGNFSIDVPDEHLQLENESGALARAFDKMNQSMRGLIKQLANTSEQLAASSEALTASAEQSAQASNQVAGSITEVAQGSEKQVQLVSSTTEIVSQMSKGIQQAAENAAVVSESAEKTARAANDGEDAIEKTVNQMSIIEQKTSDTANVIGELEEKSKQIGQILETISNIAGQTNLLALNAAIEAARAGEQGRGFAVVADEVRRLAEQSQEAARQIADLIGEVQQKTNNAVIFMNEGRKEVNTGTEVVTIAGQSFREILKMIREISNQIHEISAAIEQVSSGSQHVVNAVQEIDKESKNTAEQTQTVSAATEEQSASIEEIASSSQALAKMAEELQTAIHQFKV